MDLNVFCQPRNTFSSQLFCFFWEKNPNSSNPSISLISSTTQGIFSNLSVVVKSILISPLQKKPNPNQGTKNISINRWTRQREDLQEPPEVNEADGIWHFYHNRSGAKAPKFSLTNTQAAFSQDFFALLLHLNNKTTPEINNVRGAIKARPN